MTYTILALKFMGGVLLGGVGIAAWCAPLAFAIWKDLLK